MIKSLTVSVRISQGFSVIYGRYFVPGLSHPVTISCASEEEEEEDDAGRPIC
jgi:hypothetical protein